jgi:AraC family transcriptional regulator
MRDVGAYGSQLRRVFRVGAAPSFVTRSLGDADIAVTRLQRDEDKPHERTEPAAIEDAYLVNVPLCNLPKRQLWMDGKPLVVNPLRVGSIAIFDLKRSWVGTQYAPFHSLSFYLPRPALDAIADIEGVPQIETFKHDPTVGAEDATIAALGFSIAPAFDRPEEANRLFIDHVTCAMAAHMLFTYGLRKDAQPTTTVALAQWQEQRAKEMLISNLGGDVSIVRIAEQCRLSVTAFRRAFTQSTGLSPHRWLLDQRLQRSMNLLRNTTASVDEIASICGFTNGAHFARVFTRMLGTNPQAWRRAIRY